MKFGYTIIYVESVEETLVFYQRAFGFALKFLHESKAYGELAFVTDDVPAAFDKAVEAGAVSIKEPAQKPWGHGMALS